MISSIQPPTRNPSLRLLGRSLLAAVEPRRLSLSQGGPECL